MEDRKPRRSRKAKPQQDAAPVAPQDTPENFVSGVKDPDRDLDMQNDPAGDVELVRKTLRAICNDGNAPAAARAQAARTLAEMAGALGRHAKPKDDDGKPVGEMTRAELEAELAGQSGA